MDFRRDPYRGRQEVPAPLLGYPTTGTSSEVCVATGLNYRTGVVVSSRFGPESLVTVQLHRLVGTGQIRLPLPALKSVSMKENHRFSSVSIDLSCSVKKRP